jgi:uncharacterized delta-60 repeat protein
LLGAAAASAFLLLTPAYSSALQQPAVAAQPNGKVLVTVEQNSGVEVARLRRGGSLDETFGDHGFASIGDRGARYVTGMIVVPSGAIDLAGRLRGITKPDRFVAQLSEDGELDPGFATGGIAQPFADRFNVVLGGLAVSSEGNLLVGGADHPYDCYDPCPQVQLVASFTPDGQPTSSFGEGGVAEIPVDGNDVEPAVGSDGRILVGTTLEDPTSTGDGRPISYVSRLLPDGSLDETFGAGSGYVQVSSPVSAVATSDGGQVYAAGAAEGFFGATALASDGAVDQAFASGGLFAKQIGQVVPGVGDLLREADGSLLIAGPVGSDCRSPHPDVPTEGRCRLSVGLVHLDVSGNLDAGFGEGGVARIAISKSRKTFDPAEGVQLVESRDGVRVATPVFNGPSVTEYSVFHPSAIAVAAVRSDGTLDPHYGDNGLSLIPTGTLKHHFHARR